MATLPLFGGVEGGGTNTIAVIVDSTGKVLARQNGPGTNGWVVGPVGVADILIAMFHKAKDAAGIARDSPLQSIGLCMSGFLQPAQQEALKAAFAEKDPHLSRFYYVDNDSPGSIYTAAGARGGMVLISGTGSMGQVIDAAGKAHNCGGWGHMFGDEGSAYHIASIGIRKIFRALDGYSNVGGASAAADGAVAAASSRPKPVPDVTLAHQLMLQYFEIPSKEGMLDVFYKTFEKGRVAGFTKLLAQAATEKADPFCRSLFVKAGRHLGSMARTLAPHLTAPVAASDAVPGAAAPVRIVCVGSVWKSYSLLKDAFTAAATAPLQSPAAAASGAGAAVAAPRLAAFELVRLTETSALGAAWKGAQMAGVALELPFDTYVEVLDRHG